MYLYCKMTNIMELYLIIFTAKYTMGTLYNIYIILMLEDKALNIVSINIQQVRCKESQNEDFRQDMDVIKQGVSRIEDIVIGVNMKRYMNIERIDDDRMREIYKFGERN